MSDSDSEADFESADEDTEHDLESKNSLSENNNPAIDQIMASNLKKISTDSQIPCPTGINQENKSQFSNDCCGKNYTESENKQHGNEIKNCEKENVIRSEMHDSSRVTLRLEKKLKERNQLLPTKENSLEKDQPIMNDNEIVDTTVKSSWGFGSWGTSILSTAASSVSTFTNQVSHGIGTVLETVESTLGAPPPEELASKLTLNENEAENSLETDNLDDERNQNQSTSEKDRNETKTSGNGILTGVSSWTKVLENTGTKVLMGGLDTLEMIGKKTIGILTEGDPGLRKTRSVFTQENTLSQVLREVKSKADEMSKSENSDEKIFYSQLFDEYQGLIHLEALEILSSQSQAQVHRLMARLSSEDKLLEMLDEIRIICQNIPPLDDTPDDEKQQNFDAVFLQHIHALNLPVNTDKLMESQKRISDYFAQCAREQSEDELPTVEGIYGEAINSLAEFTAKCIEQFHKIAELILVQPRKDPSALHSAGYLTGLTTVLCVEICIVSAKFNFYLETLSKNCGDRALVTRTMTGVYLEASNSTTYIQDAYQLFIPVLQLSLLESME